MQAFPSLDVTCLPLPPTLRNKLLAAGFRTVQDLAGVGTVDLVAGSLDTSLSLWVCTGRVADKHKLFDFSELQIAPEDALVIVKAVGGGHASDGALQGVRVYHLASWT